MKYRIRLNLHPIKISHNLKLHPYFDVCVCVRVCVRAHHSLSGREHFTKCKKRHLRTLFSICTSAYESRDIYAPIIKILNSQQTFTIFKNALKMKDTVHFTPCLVMNHQLSILYTFTHALLPSFANLYHIHRTAFINTSIKHMKKIMFKRWIGYMLSKQIFTKQSMCLFILGSIGA